MSNDKDEIERLKGLMLQKTYYVMFRTIVDRSKLSEVMLEHYRWIIALEKDGKVFASGPLFSSNGEPGVGMTIFRADGIQDAEELAAGDPFVSCGAATFEIKRWQINEGRISVSIDLSDQSINLD